MIPDIIIIGGGIIGLSTAYNLLLKDPSLKITILEKEDGIARHQTGNNSGVIHSGIYYRPGSLKAENCLRGYNMLLDFANENSIHYELCGKLIVASSDKELSRMEDLYQRGLLNGLEKIEKLDPGSVRTIEPHVRALGGIFVPYTGIIDYKEVSRKLLEKITNYPNSRLCYGEKVTAISIGPEYAELITTRNRYEAGLVINTAGLYSDRIAALTSDHLPYRIIPFRGEYYRVKEDKKHLIRNLVYPVPDPEFPFLGVHFTRMITGEIEAGPNAVFSFKREGYRKTSFSLHDSWLSLSWPGFQKLIMAHFKMGVGEFYRSLNKSAFTRALQKFVPEIKRSDLVTGGAGVRAQACDRKGHLIDDFVFIEGEHMIHVLNAPSPAATASLAIGMTIAEKALGSI